jgi:hypothetical protein
MSSQRIATLLVVAIAAAFGAVNVLFPVVFDKPFERSDLSFLAAIALAASQGHLVGVWLALSKTRWPRRIVIAALFVAWGWWTILAGVWLAGEQSLVIRLDRDDPLIHVGIRDSIKGSSIDVSSSLEMIAFGYVPLLIGGATFGCWVHLMLASDFLRLRISWRDIPEIEPKERLRQYVMSDLTIGVLAAGLIFGAARTLFPELPDGANMAKTVDLQTLFTSILDLLKGLVIVVVLFTVVCGAICFPLSVPAVWIALIERRSQRTAAWKWAIIGVGCTAIECLCLVASARKWSNATFLSALQFTGIGILILFGVPFATMLLSRAAGLRAVPYTKLKAPAPRDAARG